MTNDDFSICTRCFIDENIKAIIAARGELISECSFCGTQNENGITVNTYNLIQNYIDALLVYHWDEMDYVPRYGGKHPHELFKENNMILNWSNISGKPLEPELLDSIFNCNDTGIVSYTPDYPMNWSIKSSTSSKELDAVKSAEGYLEKVSKIDELIDVIKRQSEPDRKSYRYYRARSGCVEKMNKWPTPHVDLDLGAPPYKLANAGRANRQYIPFLYLAEDSITAVNEIRPTTGDRVSVGEFQLDVGLNIFNLFNHDIANNCSDRNAVESLKAICSLNNLFSRPTGSDGKHLYIDTQMIAERIAVSGYDGISFKSSFTGNVNFVIFDKNKSRYIDKTAKIVRISSIFLGIDNIDIP